MFHCIVCGLRDEFCGGINDEHKCEKCAEESAELIYEDEIDFTLLKDTIWQKGLSGFKN